MTKCVQEEDRQRAKSKDMNTVNTATHGSGPSSSKKFKSHWGKKLGMKGNTKNVKCFFCKKTGHFKKDCVKRKQNQGRMLCFMLIKYNIRRAPHP